MKTSNASATITQMAAAGLLRRERDPADRRVLHLQNVRVWWPPSASAGPPTASRRPS